MKSKKWTLILTSVTALTLMTACGQSTTKSSTTAAADTTAITTSAKNSQSSYLQKRTMILLMMKAQPLRLSYQAHLPVSLETV